MDYSCALMMCQFLHDMHLPFGLIPIEHVFQRVRWGLEQKGSFYKGLQGAYYVVSNRRNHQSSQYKILAAVATDRLS
jgi:hypothetical protein